MRTNVFLVNIFKRGRAHLFTGGCPRGVMVKAMDCGIVVSKFVLQSRYYVHFRANTLGKGIEPPYPLSYGLDSPNTALIGGWLWHWLTYKDWYAIKQRNRIMYCYSTLVILFINIPIYSTSNLSLTFKVI